MILLQITDPDSHFIVNNILEGLVWFFIPASLVICNDVMAYVCGACPVFDCSIPVANVHVRTCRQAFR